MNNTTFIADSLLFGQTVRAVWDSPAALAYIKQTQVQLDKEVLIQQWYGLLIRATEKFSIPLGELEQPKAVTYFTREFYKKLSHLSSDEKQYIKPWAIWTDQEREKMQSLTKDLLVTTAQLGQQFHQTQIENIHATPKETQTLLQQIQRSR